jgi:hypothetical protein
MTNLKEALKDTPVILPQEGEELGPLAEKMNENAIGAYAGAVLSVPLATMAHVQIDKLGDELYAKYGDTPTKAGLIGLATGAAQSLATGVIIAGGTFLGALTQDQRRANR